MSVPARPFEHDGIAFGCDDNPEQWTPDVWDEDIALMRDAGVDLVAINIFGWAHIEPRAGEYDFARLDDIISRLHAAGIRVNLGTVTASTPATARTRPSRSGTSRTSSDATTRCATATRAPPPSAPR